MWFGSKVSFKEITLNNGNVCILCCETKYTYGICPQKPHSPVILPDNFYPSIFYTTY